MGAFALVFQWLCFLLMILSAIRALFFQRKLQTHLKAQHEDKWKELLGGDGELVKNIYLKPMNSDKSYFFFIFRSMDDLGDRLVHDYRRNVQAGLLGFCINGIAGLISFFIRGVFQS